MCCTVPHFIINYLKFSHTMTTQTNRLYLLQNKVSYNLSASVIFCFAFYRGNTGLGFPGDAIGKEPACQCRRHKRCRFSPWVGKILWRGAWQPTPVFETGEPHRQRSVAGCTPQGRTELDRTDGAHTHRGLLAVGRMLCTRSLELIHVASLKLYICCLSAPLPPPHSVPHFDANSGVCQ